MFVKYMILFTKCYTYGTGLCIFIYIVTWYFPS